jgi:hypothetical protein
MTPKVDAILFRGKHGEFFIVTQQFKDYCGAGWKEDTEEKVVKISPETARVIDLQDDHIVELTGFSAYSTVETRGYHEA